MNLNDMSDKELAAAYKNEGCSESIAKILYKRYKDQLYFYLFKEFNFEKEELKDLVQNSLIKVFDNLHKYRPEYAFSTGVYRIARNHAIDQIKRNISRGRNKLVCLENLEGKIDLEQEIYPSAEESIDRKKIYESLYLEIKKLPKKQRDPLNLFLKGMKYKEIQEKLDIPLGSVKERIFQAKKNLSKKLGDSFISNFYK